MSDFLLELRCEEIPARMQAGARAHLTMMFSKKMAEAGVSFDGSTIWSTPRRLVLIATNLPECTEAVREETKGPRVGAPPQALEGFLRKSGLTMDQLVERDGVLFAVLEKPGQAVKDVLAQTIPEIVRHFGWPKSMRWGAESVSTESARWVRPLSGIVALLGDDLVECEVAGIRSGYATRGHRFHCPGEITIGSVADYQDKLRACHVIVDHAERQDTIRTKAAAVAQAAGLTLIADEGLVIENAGLTEWPVPLLGQFDRAFLDVPPEVIQLTARVNQKYFVCNDSTGKLANAFVCTANIEADDPAVVVDGNRKVLAARLSDARFFWEQDRKTTLADHAAKLGRITFHEKLGTVADKVERVAKLARWLVEEGIVKPGSVCVERSRDTAPGLSTSLEANGVAELANQAEQAARLCKADLVTDMVGEFPELQGLMGGYYAGAEGLPDAVADAIRDHYKPVGQGDDVPTAPVTVAVSLADKLDSIAQFFAIGQAPTGSKDPFALRRSAFGILALIQGNNLRFDIAAILAGLINFIGSDDELMDITKRRFWSQSWSEIQTGYAWHKPHNAYPEPLESTPRIVSELQRFFADRLKVQQREAGVRHDLIDAVFALGGEDDLVRLLARVTALQGYVETAEGANLLAGYKRAANILKKEDWQGVEGQIAQTGEEDPLAMVDDPDLKDVVAAKMAMRDTTVLSYTPEPAEKALIDALDAAEPQAEAAIAAEDFAGAMSALASLRAPIDAFFEAVTVNDDDPAKRATRLDLLARFRAAVHNVADFSRIEG